MLNVKEISSQHFFNTNLATFAQKEREKKENQFNFVDFLLQIFLLFF